MRRYSASGNWARRASASATAARKELTADAATWSFTRSSSLEPEVIENRAVRVERLSSQTVRQPCSSAEDVPAIGLWDDLGKTESPVAVLYLQEVPRRRSSDVDLAVMEPCGPKPKVAQVWLLLILVRSAELRVLVGSSELAERYAFAAKLVRCVGGQNRAQ